MVGWALVMLSIIGHFMSSTYSGTLGESMTKCGAQIEHESAATNLGTRQVLKAIPTRWQLL